MKRRIKSLILVTIIGVLLCSCAKSQTIELDMVEIPHTSYKMLRTEVTQKLYMQVMGYNPSEFHGDDLPVESVTWIDAIKFCNELSVKNGLNPVYSSPRDTLNGVSVVADASANGYRLPTAQEWEYAARGGEKYRYSGSNYQDEVAWYDGNSGGTSHPVAQKKPNGYGLYDMTGNVKERCWDIIYYSGKHSDAFNGYYNKTRGGSWKTEHLDVLGDYPLWWNSTKLEDAFSTVGFRIVQNIK